MGEGEQLITNIEILCGAKYIKKPTISYIEDNMNLLKEYATVEESKYLDKIIKIVAKQYIKATDRRRLTEIRKPVINIVRKYHEEFNNEEAVYESMLTANNNSSKTFKKDIAKILTGLRKEGKLEITNNEIKIDNVIRSKVCRYDCYDDKQYLRFLIINGQNMSISRYMDKPVLYMFIMPLKTNHKNIMITIGYTDDIIGHWGVVETEFKCRAYLIKVKIIGGKHDEENFCTMLKQCHPDLVEQYIIDDNEMTGLYKLSPTIIRLFDDHKPTRETTQ